MQEENLIKIIKSIQSGSKTEEKELYRLLYKSCFSKIMELRIPKEEAEDLFQDAFFVLVRRLQSGKIADSNSSITENYLIRTFTRIYLQLVYSLERAVFFVVKNVQQQIPQARHQLVLALTTERVQLYTEKLIQQYRLTAVTKDDIINESIASFLERIDTGNFTLEPQDSNALNKNKLFKYFNLVVMGTASGWRKKEFPTIDMEAAGNEVSGQESDALSLIESDALYFKVRALLHNLDEAGQFILKETYTNNRTPKQIAAIIPNVEYQTTEKIVKKKISSLNKLRKDFAAIMNELDTKVITQVIGISSFVMEHLIEPCKTILQNAFPPKEKSMDEIAEILQVSFPARMVGDLKIGEQVKKRKYKCMRLLHEGIWEQLLQLQKI